MNKFYNELNKLYDVEDFTGHLGVLLGNDDGFENEADKEQAVKGALEFLQSIYDIASRNI